MEIEQDLFAASAKLSKMDFTFRLGELSLTVLWFRVMRNTGSWLINRHTHSSYEFHIVASGACRVRLDDGEFVARAGEIYLTAPYVYHEQSSFGDGDYTEFSIDYDVEGMPDGNTEEGVLLETLRNAGCRPVPDSCGCSECFREALREAEEQRLGYYSAIKSCAVRILVNAARALDGKRGEKYPVPRKTGGDDQRFAEIRKFIEDNLYTQISISDLTSHFYLSGKQISRIVRSHTDLSAKAYINRLRLQTAKRLLKDTNLGIGEISERLGFSSVYYFYQFFKRQEGFPPGVFRDNVQKM